MSINRATPEEKAEGVRLFQEHRNEYPSEWAAMKSIATKLGRTPETLRTWVRQAEVDDGKRDGTSTDERERVKRLERENKELRRANEILKAASIFFATELDGPTRK
jgi:transposase-like protein